MILSPQSLAAAAPRLLRPAGMPAASFVVLTVLLTACSSGSSTSVPDTATGEAQSGPAAAPVALEPGHYKSPLVRLQQLETDTTMLETQEVKYRPADGRLFACTDLHGFEVVNASDPANMRYVANFVSPESIAKESGFGKDPPGCMHLAYDPDRVITDDTENSPDVVYFTHRGNETNPSYLAAYDVAADPPAELALYQEPGVSFEGVDMAKGNVYAGLHDQGLGVFRLEDGVLQRIATATGLENAWGVFAQGDTVFVADGSGGLATVDVTDPTQPAVLGRVATGGHARSVVVDGTTAYVGAGPAGLVVVDVADLTKPTVIGRAETPASASQVSYSDGRVFVGAWTDARVYDVADPTDPRLIASTRFDAQSRFGTPTQGVGDLDEGRPLVPSRTFAVAAHDDIVFVGNWHLLYSYRLHPDRLAPSMLLPDSASWLDLGVAEPGQTNTLALAVTNQGTAPLNLLNVWADDPAFTVVPEQLSIEPEASAVLSVTYAPTGLEQQTAKLRILSDDPLQPVRTAGLVGNRPGLAVGQPLPETRLALLDGGHWSSAEQVDKVQVLSYFATF